MLPYGLVESGLGVNAPAQVIVEFRAFGHGFEERVELWRAKFFGCFEGTGCAEFAGSEGVVCRGRLRRGCADRDQACGNE